MRHGKSFNHLSRTSAHRKALLANLASSLIMHKRIKTTTAKAKTLRSFIEPIITRSKEDSTHSRRLAFSYLGNKHAVSELFREVSLKIGDRPGGYTRILKIDNRHGDNADMCIIELVDYNENLMGEKAAEKAKMGRRRRAKKKPGEPKAVAEAEVTTAEQEISQDETLETADERIAETEEVEAVGDSVETEEEISEEESTEEEAKTEEQDKAEKDKPGGDSETGKAKDQG